MPAQAGTVTNLATGRQQLVAEGYFELIIGPDAEPQFFTPSDKSPLVRQ